MAWGWAARGGDSSHVQLILADSILHALTRRDVRGPSDQIKLLIDSYDDRRTGFEFAVNPDGVKRDFSMSNDSNAIHGAALVEDRQE